MKRALVLTIASVLVAVGVCPAAPNTDTHVIMISIDGLRPAIYLDPHAAGVQVPNLAALRDSGAYAERMVGVFPSVTYPSHTTLVTGTRPAAHNILNNFLMGTMTWYLNTDQIKSETLWQAAHKAGLSTSIVTWPASYGAQVDWLIPENLSFGLSDVPAAIHKGSTPGLFDELEKKADHFDIPSFERVNAGGKLDEMTTAYAARIIRDHKPALLLIHFLDADHMEHSFGPESAEARRAFENIDAQIGTLRKAVQEAGIASKTNFVIVGDHGFAPVHTGINITGILAAIGEADIHDGKATTKTVDVWSSGASGGFYAKPGASAVDLAAFQERFHTYVDAHFRGLMSFLPQSELRRLGSFTGAIAGFTVDSPGYMVAEAPVRETTVAGPLKGMHGYHPDLPAMATGFIGSGPAFEPGQRLTMVRSLDVAPTLARVLGVALPEAEGAVIVGALRNEQKPADPNGSLTSVMGVPKK